MNRQMDFHWRLALEVASVPFWAMVSTDVVVSLARNRRSSQSAQVLKLPDAARHFRTNR